MAVARWDVSSNACVGVGATHVDIFLRALPHAVPGRRGSKMATIYYIYIYIYMMHIIYYYMYQLVIQCICNVHV